MNSTALASATNVKHADMLVFLGFGMHSILKGIVLPLIKADFDISYTQSGLLLTASTIGFFMAAMLSGKISERLGQLRLLAIFAFLLSASALTIISTSKIEYVIVAFFVSGVSYGGIESVSTPTLKRFHQGSEDRAINAVFTFYIAGGFVSAMLCRIFLRADIDWRWCYGAACLICALGGLSMVRLKDHYREKIAKIDFLQFKSLAKNRTFLWMCLAVALFSGVETSTHNWLSTFMSDGAQLALADSCILAAMFYASICVGRMICGRLLWKIRARAISLVAALLAGVVLVSISFVTNITLLWVLTAIYGLCTSSLYPMLVSITSGTARESMAFSATFVAISLGNISTNAALGAIADICGVRSTFRFDSILLFLVVGILILVGKKLNTPVNS